MESTVVNLTEPAFPADELALEDAAELLKALGNEHRLVIVNALMSGEKSVSELNAMVPISQSALSQHLAALRRSHMLKSRKQAQVVFYRICCNKVEQLMQGIRKLYAA